MVLELHLRARARRKNLNHAWAYIALALIVLLPCKAEADARLADAQEFFRAGQYFKAARYAFAAADGNAAQEAEANAWVTLGLSRAGLHNSASYFFIKTLQSGHKPAIRRVLVETQELLMRVGGDLLRKYLIRHTGYEDYDAVNRSAYLYSLGKDALLEGKEDRAIGYFNGISSKSVLWPFVLQLRGTAQALLGHGEAALSDFRSCVERASDYVTTSEGFLSRQQAKESADLAARCRAGEARTLYQMDRFAEADRVYDSIPKASLVWPDILFEQAWNSFGKQEVNRSLGKLVTYKSPALSFVFNSEVDVLRAQSYLTLCMYGDANDVVNEFNGKYARVGEDVKRFVESNAANLGAFYDAGKSALAGSLSTRNEFHKLMNRFVRGPYFQNLVAAENSAGGELAAIQRFSSVQSSATGQGFPGFLEQVLKWRVRSVRMLGGAYVKNSLLDYHQALLSDFDKMAFIKLEMLSRAKDRLMSSGRVSRLGERSRGNVQPSRRDDQYKWGFNGEFWADELGDYVFGLESECGKNG